MAMNCRSYKGLHWI